MAKPDLNKLRTEIDNRKRERNISSSPLGESTGANIAPRDAFLYELIRSHDTGVETPATDLIKLVENQVAIKNKETVRHNINETAVVDRVPARLPIQNNKATEMSPERDEQLFTDLQNKSKQTLADSIAPYVGGQKKNLNPTAGAAVSPMNLNEGYLVENVKKIVDNYLIDNFGPVVEEAIKGTIIEMYAAERIKEVLTENKEMIRAVIIEVIKEISDKNKAKKAQL
jgi:hypothetical protein